MVVYRTTKGLLVDLEEVIPKPQNPPSLAQLERIRYLVAVMYEYLSLDNEVTILFDESFQTSCCNAVFFTPMRIEVAPIRALYC